jgi:guanylate kinase
MEQEAGGLGSLFIVAAPSGAGKTSLVRALVDSLDNVVVSVSTTTRAARPGEIDGIDYHFVDVATFKGLVADGRFLEHARVFDHYYGTSEETVKSRLDRGLDVILEIDWQGARLVRQRIPDCRSVFILPPSRQILEKRLRTRGQDGEALIARRMRDAVSEMSHYHEFDYLIVNDDFAQALGELQSIFTARRQETRIQRSRHRDLIECLLADG